MRSALVAAAIAAGIVTACGSDGGSTAERNAVVASGVGVVAEGCSLVAQLGSGVVVDAPGTVVTVAHTIAGATSITVVDADGAEHAAEVRAFDADADLAVLAVPTLDAPPLALGTAQAGAAGAVTWEREAGVRFVDVDVVKLLRITIEDIYVDAVVERTGLEIAGPIEVGDSGGPVVSPDGDVIGIIYANSRDRGGVGFATDHAEVADVLGAATSGDSEVDRGRCV